MKTSMFKTTALIVIFLTIGLVSKSQNYLTNADGSTLYETKKELMLDYSLCSCLSQFLRSDSARFTDNSQYVLSDLGELYIGKQWQKLDSLAYNYLTEVRSSKGSTYLGRKSPFHDCIIFYKSKELDLLIDELLKEEDRQRANRP